MVSESVANVIAGDVKAVKSVKVGQSKGASRANEVRKAKTKGVIFFLRCLNARAETIEFQRYYHFKHLSHDYRLKLVRDFDELPHFNDQFFEMMNSYRAMKIMQILGMNVNRGHLKFFSGHPYGNAKVEQNHAECEFMLSMIRENKKVYKKMLKRFVDAFVDDLKLGWAKEDNQQADLDK